VTASKGLTTRIKPAGDRSKQHRNVINVVIDASTGDHLNDFEDDSGDWHQFSHQRVHIAEKAALDTLTRLEEKAKCLQPRDSDAQQRCSLSR
jgi:hypothetical protein